MTRQEKIELLKGIASGTISVQALLPKRFTIRVGYAEDQSDRLINGRPVSRDEFRKAIGPGPHKFKIRYGNKDSNS